MAYLYWLATQAADIVGQTVAQGVCMGRNVMSDVLQV